MKHTKRWQCCKCNKEYCFISGAIKHRDKKHNGHAKFRDLNAIW